MSIVDHNQSFQVPYSCKDTYTALQEAIAGLSGFRIDRCDDSLMTVYVKAGVSLFSWGENITVSIQEALGGGSVVSILSTPKTGAMLGGAMDMGKNRKNIEAISKALSTELQPYKTVSKKSAVQKQSGSIAEEIGKLAELRDKGILTDEEFNKKKKELLG